MMKMPVEGGHGKKQSSGNILVDMKVKYGLLVWMLFGWLSCTEENPLPEYPVLLRLDLKYQDKALRDIPSFRTYTLSSHTINNNYRYFGYGGILVVHSHHGGYFAYDLACPYEWRRDVLVEPDKDVLYATCPQCGSKFDLINDGRLKEGRAKRGLKEYRGLFQNGDELIVRN